VTFFSILFFGARQFKDTMTLASTKDSVIGGPKENELSVNRWLNIGFAAENVQTPKGDGNASPG